MSENIDSDALAASPPPLRSPSPKMAVGRFGNTSLQRSTAATTSLRPPPCQVESAARVVVAGEHSSTVVNPDRVRDCSPNITGASHGGQGAGSALYAQSSYQLPLNPHYYHVNAMYGVPVMQPMSGMAGVGYAQMHQNLSAPAPVPEHNLANPGARPTGTSDGGSASVCPQPGTSGANVSDQQRRKERSVPSHSRARDGSHRRRSSSRVSRTSRRKRRSHSRDSRLSSRGRGRSSSSRASSSPSPRRSFVRRTREQRSRSSSLPRSVASGEDSQFERDEDFDSLSLKDCKALVGELRPDLVSASNGSISRNKRVLSAGERALKRKTDDDSLRFAQAQLVTDTLDKLTFSIQKEERTPALDQPAEHIEAALKTGDLLPPAPSFLHSKRQQIPSLLAEGSLPNSKLIPSSSDLRSRSHRGSKEKFTPLLREKGILSLEESALRGLQSLSITDTILGIVVDCVGDQDLDGAYSRRPSKSELLQLLDFACKGINHAVDATARCYLNSILIRRDSFLGSADKLPNSYDRSALRSLPISAPALIGPQVEKNVEKWEKQQFDSSVRSIVAKASKRRSPSPKKRAHSADNRPSSKFARFQPSSARFASSSQKFSNKGRFNSKQGKSKPKASAHPQ